MTESVNQSPVVSKSMYVKWLPAVIFKPLKTFKRIAEVQRATWQTAMLFLTITALLYVIGVGWVKQHTAYSGEENLPPDFQYYSPEQQAQYMQAQQAQQGPVFIYVLPALGIVIGLWLSWLVFGGLLHLILTMVGGRGDTGAAMNVVAWASLPLGLRDLLRLVYVLGARKLIASPGLSGFAPTGDATGVLFLTSLMALLDLYLIWQFILVVIGVRTAFRLPSGKAFLGVLVTFLIVISLLTLPGFLSKLLAGLSFTRPFFF